MLNFFSIAGIPDDRTKCTTWSWLSQGQEIFKGVCHLIETSLKVVAFIYSPETDHPFQSFKEIVAACLVKDPVKRPTAEKLLKHRFFKYARSNEILARSILDGLSPLGERFRMLRVCILISVMQYSSTRTLTHNSHHACFDMPSLFRKKRPTLCTIRQCMSLR